MNIMESADNIHTYTQRQAEKETQTDRQPDRQTDNVSETETDRQTDRRTAEIPRHKSSLTRMPTIEPELCERHLSHNSDARTYHLHLIFA